MKKRHFVERAEQRYYIQNINEQIIIADILANKCILIKTDIEKYSHTFLTKYLNKYIKVVTDFNVEFIKTIIPISNKDIDLINKFLTKII